MRYILFLMTSCDHSLRNSTLAGYSIAALKDGMHSIVVVTFVHEINIAISNI